MVDCSETIEVYLFSDITTCNSIVISHFCKNPYSRTLLGVNFLFTNRFSKFLLHILGLKEC